MQQEWIRYHRQLEEYSETLPPEHLIEIPLNQDVLFGKGNVGRTHIGNLRLQFLVEESLDAYNEATDRETKSEMIQHIFKKIQNAGGRFLSKESGIWIPVTHDLATRKISDLFRSRRFDRRRRQPDKPKTTAVKTTTNAIANPAEDEAPAKRTRKD